MTFLQFGRLKRHVNLTYVRDSGIIVSRFQIALVVQTTLILKTLLTIPLALRKTRKSGYNADLQHHICVFSLRHQHTIISTYYRFVFNLLSYAVCTIWTPTEVKKPTCLVIGLTGYLISFICVKIYSYLHT